MSIPINSFLSVAQGHVTCYDIVMALRIPFPAKPALAEMFTAHIFVHVFGASEEIGFVYGLKYRFGLFDCSVLSPWGLSIRCDEMPQTPHRLGTSSPALAIDQCPEDQKRHTDPWAQHKLSEASVHVCSTEPQLPKKTPKFLELTWSDI